MEDFDEWFDRMYEDLKDSFIDEHSAEWMQYLNNAYIAYTSGYGDMMAEIEADRQLEEQLLSKGDTNGKGV